jgi:hypothetical protein
MGGMDNAKRMAERRNFARKKRRFLVEFDLRCAHRLHLRRFRQRDLRPLGSAAGPGTMLTANIHLPDNKRVVVRGRVVRSFRVATGLSRLVPSGFSIRLQESPEDYFQFLATL